MSLILAGSISLDSTFNYVYEAALSVWNVEYTRSTNPKWVARKQCKYRIRALCVFLFHENEKCNILIFTIPQLLLIVFLLADMMLTFEAEICRELEGVSPENRDFLSPEITTSETNALKITNIPVFIWRLGVMILWGQIHYSGHWSGWALKISTFLVPNGTCFARCHFRAQ